MWGGGLIVPSVGTDIYEGHVLDLRNWVKFFFLILILEQIAVPLASTTPPR